MRLGLDARKIDDFGIGTYIQALLGEFAALGEPEEVVAYLPPGRPLPTTGNGRGRLVARVERARPYSLGGLWCLARQVRRDRVEVFHAPHYVCPPLLPCPAVVTVHDLIHLRFPRPRRPLATLYARVMLRLAVTRAARVITVSGSTRDDLERRLHTRPDRIRVIPNGVAPRFRPAEDPAAVRRALAPLGLVPPYFLFVGNPLPHKNLTGLLDAFAGLPADVPPLVLAGIGEAARPRVEAACAQRGLASRVRLVPPLGAEAMPRLYQGALALVSPSLWEGFGLPALEAMACGTPVLAAARGGLLEVVGRAGLLVEPTDVDALREGLYNLAAHVAIRETLREAGLARAREFSWRRAALATIAVYREVFSRGPGTSGETHASRAGP